jgi:hypothetical protein
MTFQSDSLSEPIRSATRQKQTPAFNKLGKDGCAGRTPLRERRAYLIRLADLLDGRAYGRLITAESKPLPDAIAEVKKSAPLVGPDRKPAATLGRTGSRRLIALPVSGSTTEGRPRHGRSGQSSPLGEAS